MSKPAVAALLLAILHPFVYIPLAVRLPEGNVFGLVLMLVVPSLAVICGCLALWQTRTLYSEFRGKWPAIIGIVLGIAWGVNTFFDAYMEIHARSTPIAVICMSNQRGLAMGILLYAQDHNYRMPADLADITNHLGSVRQLECPSVRDKGYYGIGYNQAVAGLQIDRLHNPDQLLLTADCRNVDDRIVTRADIDDTRHEEGQRQKFYWDWSLKPLHGPPGFVAGYADGHAEWHAPGTKVRLEPEMGKD